jgi:hypothetical protein
LAFNLIFSRIAFRTKEKRIVSCLCPLLIDEKSKGVREHPKSRRQTPRKPSSTSHVKDAQQMRSQTCPRLPPLASYRLAETFCLFGSSDNMKSIMTSHVKDVQQKICCNLRQFIVASTCKRVCLARRKICSATNESKESQ